MWAKIVDGSVVDDFGATRPGGHVHTGVDVFAADGAFVRAPFAGVVVPLYLPTRGRSVMVLGRGGDVLCCHLGAVGRIGPVRAGMVIGYAGRSGTGAGDVPHVHVEWHPRFGQAARPPLED